MRLICILFIAATLTIPTTCKYGDWYYKAFFTDPPNPLRRWMKNNLLGDVYEEYFTARSEAEEKKAIVKISYLTQLSAIRTIMDSYKNTIRCEYMQLVEEVEDGKIVNGYKFLNSVKAEILRSNWNSYGLCQLLLFSDGLRYKTLPFRGTNIMKFHKIQCSPDWRLNLEDPMHVEIWIEANFVEFFHNFPFDIHLSKYINDRELSLLTKQKLIKLFGKARFMVLHQEYNVVLNKFANEDKQNLLIEFYKSFFTPKDRSLTDWRTKFAADYLVYVEWQKHEFEAKRKEIKDAETIKEGNELKQKQKARKGNNIGMTEQDKNYILSTLEALKKLWQDSLKVYLDDLDAQWIAFITSPKWKDNWTPEMTKKAVQNAYMNQEKMYCEVDVQVKKKSPLQVTKECMEQEIKYIFAQQKKGKLKGADEAEIQKSWRACMVKELILEAKKKIRENLRAVEEMHLEMIKELCKDETNGFREFVRNEAHTSLVQKMTGVTLGALLRLTKPEEPSMKQDAEKAKQKMDENMDKDENESDDEIVEEKLTDIEEKNESPSKYKNPIGKLKFPQKSTSPTYSSVIARERNKARVARKWLTMATNTTEIVEKPQKTVKSSKAVIKNQNKEITVEKEDEVKEERIFGQNFTDNDAFDLELETQPINDLKQLYAIYLGKDKINKNFEYLLHISVLREAISQKIKTAEILNESKMRNDDKNNLIKLEKIFDDFKKSWKNRINKSRKEKNKIVFMKIMLAKHFEFFEGIKNLPYQSLSEEKIMEMELLMEKGFGKIKSINFEFLSKLHFNMFALMVANNSSKEPDFMQETEIFTNKKYLSKLQFIMQYNDQAGKKSKLEKFTQKLQEMIESGKEMLKQGKLDSKLYNMAVKPNINPALYKFIQNDYLSFEKSNLVKFYNILGHEYEISEDVIDANESALDWLEERVAKWIRIVSRAKEREDLYKNDPTLKNFRLIIYGSHLLETNTVTSDIDVLCVVPNYVNQYNFTDSDSKDSLYSILKSGLQKTDFINVVAKSRVLLIQLKVNGVEIDINFAKTPWVLVNGRDLMQDGVIEENTHVKSVYALAGYRGLLRQRQMCPPSATFKNFLRTLKLWAKKRLIYSNILGYLSGTSLTTMATKLCLIYPNGNLVFLLKQFFFFFKFWGWPRPALLEEPIKNSEFAKARALNVVAWSEEKMKRDDDKMPIIMPTFPEQNTAHNVNAFSKQIIMREIERAYEHLAAIDMTTANSSDLEHLLENFLEKLNHETDYSHFLMISCVPKITNLENAKNEVAIICSEKKPRLRVVLEKWATHWKEHILEYHVIPTVEKSGQCRMDDNTTSECIVWMVAANFASKAMNSKFFSETLQLSDYLPYSLHSQYVSGNELKQRMEDFIQEDSNTSGVKNLEEKMLE